jgi:hypothetical protein
MEIFDARQPVAVPQPGFDTAAHSEAETPARVRDRLRNRYCAVTGVRNQRVPIRCLHESGPGEPAGAVGQHVGPHQKSEPGTSRPEVVELVGPRPVCDDGCRTQRGCPRGRRGSFDARARDVDFQPAHPGAVLPIGAGMEAPDAAAGIDPREWRSLAAEGIVGEWVAAPSVARMGAKVEPAPAPDRRGRGRQRTIGGVGGAGHRQRHQPDACKQMPFQDALFHGPAPTATIPVGRRKVSSRSKARCDLAATVDRKLFHRIGVLISA